MKFCKECHGLMKPDDEGYFECISCGFKEQALDGDLTSKEKIAKKPDKKQGIIEHGNIFATFDFKCKKCGYDKAEVIERQPYISDEDSLTFLRCGKCGFTQKLARKTS